MGIPSYFSYIIRNHANIIRNRNKMREVALNSLYMDCNSIIYDSIRSDSMSAVSDDGIIQMVIQKIDAYVRTIKPTNVLYIAFDGVAPLAKMNQQRTRRYKTGYLSSLDFSSEQITQKDPAKKAEFNTALITPGTAFMRKLSEAVNTTFMGSEYTYGVSRLVVSASDEEGEGEHKMFQYIRDHVQPNETVAVYGLDSDLIMLSLIHSFYCKNIFIFREAPEFAKSVLPKDAKILPNELLFIDTRLLGLSILKEMGVSLASDEKTMANRINDYIFMCFLLGNDFLPHFPGLNIRTHANHTLLEFYRIHIGAYPDRFLVSISPPTINWNWVKLFISKLSLLERTKIAEELVEREKMEKRVLSTSKTATEEDRKQTFENTPILYRGEERYIAPNEMGWESRYYERAFGSALTSSEIQRVCVNYLQGLEWVFRYYIEGCCDWRWKYDGHYAPLLSDLVSHIPNKTTSLLRPSTKGAFHPNTQLLYVIPPWNHDEVFGTSNSRIQKIKKVNAGLFREKSELTFQWMFCRYFWESHAKLPEVDLRTMETWNEEFVPKSKKAMSR